MVDKPEVLMNSVSSEGVVRRRRLDAKTYVWWRGQKLALTFTLGVSPRHRLPILFLIPSYVLPSEFCAFIERYYRKLPFGKPVCDYSILHRGQCRRAGAIPWSPPLDRTPSLHHPG